MNNYILIGVITSAHGIKGQVKTKFFTDDIQQALKYELVAEGNKVLIEKSTILSKDTAIIKFKHLSDRNKAEESIGLEIYTDSSNLPQNDNSEYYIKDLIDCIVRNKAGEEIGYVSNVFNFGAGDILEISHTSNNKKEFTKFSNQLIDKVDIEKKFIILK